MAGRISPEDSPLSEKDTRQESEIMGRGCSGKESEGETKEDLSKSWKVTHFWRRRWLEPKIVGEDYKKD